VAQTEHSLSRNPSSAVHCVIVDRGAVQIVATRGIVMLDLQDRQVGVDGHARYHHASVAMHLADAREMLRLLADAIAEASARPDQTARWSAASTPPLPAGRPMRHPNRVSS
jgi:hypothetical protein